MSQFMGRKNTLSGGDSVQLSTQMVSALSQLLLAVLKAFGPMDGGILCLHNGDLTRSC